MGHFGTRSRVIRSYKRFGTIIPIDKKMAARQFPGADTKISDYCVESHGYQYIYINFTKEMNPTLHSSSLGKIFEWVGKLSFVKRDIPQVNTTRKRQRSRQVQ
jgi:hypothetical protein